MKSLVTKLALTGLALATLALSVSASRADVKISDLPAGTTLAGTEATPVVQSGVTVKTTPSAISTYTKSTLTSTDIRGLWSGSCSISTFLRGDGACASVAPTPAALTKVDDTNVTLTLGGAPSTALLNAASLTLGWSGQLSVARGGTGATTLTGVLHGNGASAFTAANVALASEVSGTLPVANGGTGATTLTGYLKGNGTSAFTASAIIPYSDLTGTPSIPAAANPTSTIGLSAVNGSASTFLRSDGAPALDQAIVPTWTGVHTWSAAEVRQLLNETDAASNEKLWDWDLNSKTLKLRTRTDADGAGVDVVSVVRGTGTALTGMTFGNAVSMTYDFPGTGTATFGGSVNLSGGTSGVTAGRYTVNGTTVPVNGIYRPGTNRLGWSTNTTYRGEIDASGQLIVGTLGAGLSIKEGSNAKMGTAVLSTGAATVSTTAVTANSRVFLTSQVDGGTPGFLRVSTRTAGTSFTITSSSALDTSTVAWIIIEPSP